MPSIFMFKIADLVAIAGVLASAGYYTFLAPWWREAFGTSLVIKDILLGLMLALVGLSLFFNLSRLTSETVAWVQLVLLFLVGVTLFWRTLVFGRMAHQEGRDWAPQWLRRLLSRNQDSAGEGSAEDGAQE